MTRAIFSLSATHWWSVLGWTIWSYFWIGLAEFLLVLPFYLLLRRRLPELRYNVLLLWMALLCITPLFLLARVSQSLPAPVLPVISANTVPAVAVVPPATIRPEPPDSIPNVIPPDRKLNSIPTLIVPDQAISRMPGANRPRNGSTPAVPFPQIQIFPLSPGDSASTIEHVVSPWIAALIPWLPLLWMLGVVFSFLLIGFGLVGAERFRRQATILTSGPLYERCAELAARLQIRGKVLVALCDCIATPILLGIWRPLILLPLAAETGWPPDQLDMILLHELAHVRRFDNFVHLLQRLAEGLLFFQPAVWILSRWISLEREHCCDSLVVRATGRPQEYARTLARLALGEPFPSNLAPSSAMAQSHLLTRIRRILNQEQPLQVSRGTLGIASACLFLALLIVGALNAREISLPAAQEEAAANQKLTDQQSAAKQSEPIKVPVPEATLPTVWIQVVDVANVPIPGVQVEMLDSKRQSILQSQSDEKGWIAIPPRKCIG
ncbi:MAG: M56 family metallopeptidase [Planctomycetales bacterium]